MYILNTLPPCLRQYFQWNVGSFVLKIKTGSFFQPILIKYQDMFNFKNFWKYKILQILEARMIAGLISGCNSQRVDAKKISDLLAFQILNY